MCGRFTLRTPAAELVEWFDLDSVPDLTGRYNIAPTQEVAAVFVPRAGAGRKLEFFRWGLIPSWSKDRAIGNQMINARSETAASKPSFRSAFKQRRCLVPADGYYEWQAASEGQAARGKKPPKQPFHIRLPSGAAFGIAGLWECWEDPENGPVLTCTLLTTSANDSLRAFHDRMPVILQRQDYALWLDPAVESAERLTPLLRPYPDGELQAVAVNTRVNSPRHDDAACLEPG